MQSSVLRRLIITRTIATAAAIVLLASCQFSSAGSVPTGNIVWDGAQFVAHDATTGEGARYWTSPDGRDWQQHRGFPMTRLAKLPASCHPDFPCDLAPETVEVVPFHFATPANHAVAGRGDIVLMAVGIRYTPTTPGDDSSLSDERLHPEFLNLAAAQSACFAELRANQQQGIEPTIGESPVVMGLSHSPGEVWASCTTGLPGNAPEEAFRVDLGDVLDEHQTRLVAAGSERQLFVTSPNGEHTLVADPPRYSWLQDGVGPTRTTLSLIATTNSRFWSVDDGVVVSSVNGVEWEAQPAIDLDGRRAKSVLATPGGDLVVASARQYHPAERGSEPVAVVSHDDGVTWGEPFILPGDDASRFVSAVGPAGITVIDDSTTGADLIFVDDQTGMARFSISGTFQGVLDDAAVGNEHLLVPLSEQEGSETDVVLRAFDAATGELID